MSDNNLMFLAKLLQEFYVLPYDHDELIELLAKIKDGHILTLEEYNMLKYIFDPDSDDNTQGDVLFTGNYNDLKNKPFIPKNMSDLNDYPTVMSRINQMFINLSQKDKELAESISDNARFMSAIEIVINEDIKDLRKLIEACKLFQGESLDDVITNIQGELGWLDLLREDLEKGKVLSEKDFTAAFEQILLSIENTAGGLAGYIKDVIAESIIEPGQPNGNGVYRLDSIGEALATKVDKIYGYGLSRHDFSDKYKEILDSILNHNSEGTGNLQDYVLDIVDRYKEEFTYYIEDIGDRILEYTENAIQDFRLELDEIEEKMLKELEETKEEALDGVKFKEGDGPTSIAVGGIKKGTKLEGRYARDILLEMLCPFVLPTVSAELVLAHPGYLHEIGDIIEVKGIQAYVEAGSLPINRIVFKQKEGNQYRILGAYKNGTTSFWFPNIFELTSSIESDYFVVDVEDTDGNVVSSLTNTVDFVFPIFHGNAYMESEFTEAFVLGLNRFIARPGEELTLYYTTQNQRMVLALPETYGSIAHIFDQNGYVITNSFDVKQITMYFEVKEKVGDSYQINRYPKTYYIYYSNTNTVKDFKITFTF